MGGILGNVYNNTAISLNRHATALESLQEQVATGSRINRPSDDPSTGYQILGLNTQDRSLGNYIDNLGDVMGLLETSSSIISGDGGGSGMIPALADVKSIITQIASGTYSSAQRQLTAGAIDDILEQMVSLANTKQRNQYLFSGGDTATVPYVVQRDGNNRITGVTYQGSLINREVEVAEGVDSSAFYVGNDVFCSDDRGTPEFILGSTGVAAGTGTSNVSGFTWLEITQPGGAGTLYRLSIDGGTTFADTAFPPVDTNLAVTHGVTGEILYVNTTAITDTGHEVVAIDGTHDVFDTLITTRDLFLNEKGLSDAQVVSLASSATTALDEVNELLLQTSITTGSKIGFLNDIKGNLENIKFNTKTEASRIGEADIAQIAIDISRREVLYQMSLAVAGKIMSMSLLDFMR